MKKLVIFLVAMAVVLGSFSAAVAQENKISVFDNNPDGYIRYVNFSFTAPWSNCGEAETYKWERGYWGESGSWEMKNQGEELFPGWYFFKNPCEGMQIVLQGEMNDFDAQASTWSAVEIEPADVGLFVRGWQEGAMNPGLPISDKDWDYHILAPTWGVQASLPTYLSNHFIYMGGQLIAVMISNERGFLQKILFVGSEAFNETIVDQDDVVILVYYQGTKKLPQARKELQIARTIINSSR